MKLLTNWQKFSFAISYIRSLHLQLWSKRKMKKVGLEGWEMKIIEKMYGKAKFYVLNKYSYLPLDYNIHMSLDEFVKKHFDDIVKYNKDRYNKEFPNFFDHKQKITKYI